ncbi:MAG TPA: 2Fe-2S iron-sulfur cluster-binding protein [Aggregatilineales bacterium]|nr:2Fe-2S iron-sulfur cluster-binding protein [Aggregatilineales bacterium]
MSKITDAAIAIGCVAPTVIRLPNVEDFLKGKTLSDAVIAEAAQLAAETPHPIDDIRGPAEYRTEMIGVYIRRSLNILRAGHERATWVHNPAMLWGENRALVQETLPQMVHHERNDADTITTTINGKAYTVTGGAHKTLLRFLREDLKLTGTKEGCAEGECGACTVFLDDVAVMSCMVPAPRAHGAEIITVEGLANEDGTLHPIQQGFVEAGAVQCGYCTPGFLMAGAKLLDEKPNPTREQVEQSISGNLCRCTGYYKILEAFELARQKLKEKA